MVRNKSKYGVNAKVLYYNNSSSEIPQVEFGRIVCTQILLYLVELERLFLENPVLEYSKSK